MVSAVPADRVPHVLGRSTNVVGATTGRAPAASRALETLVASKALLSAASMDVLIAQRAVKFPYKGSFVAV